MKTCTRCKMEKQATPEYFYRRKTSKDGLNSNCKDCDKEYRKQKQAKNKNKKFIYDDKIMRTCVRCELEKPATPEYFSRERARMDGLNSWCKECRREHNQIYKKENREYHLEYMRNHYKENKESYAEYSRRYHLKNPEVNRIGAQRRRDRMEQLPHTLTDEEWNDTLEFFNHSCAYCGVSDDSVGKEHIIPVVKGGGYTQDNIIPACQSCNLSKHVRDMEEWYVSCEYYDEERLNKILDYVKIMEEI